MTLVEKDVIIKLGTVVISKLNLVNGVLSGKKSHLN